MGYQGLGHPSRLLSAQLLALLTVVIRRRLHRPGGALVDLVSKVEAAATENRTVEHGDARVILLARAHARNRCDRRYNVPLRGCSV